MHQIQVIYNYMIGRRSHSTKGLAIMFVMVMGIFLSSCSWFGQAMPDHRMVVMIQTDKTLNPDEKGHPGPLSVDFYQLSKTDNFDKADYYTLVDKPEATLGADLLAVSNVNLVPRIRSRLILPLKENVKFIGVVGSYHDVQGVVWRFVIPLDSSWGREKIRLGFSAYGIEKLPAYDTGEEYTTSLKKPDLNYGVSLAGRGNMRYEVLSHDNE